VRQLRSRQHDPARHRRPGWALDTLAAHVRQIHIKDALSPSLPGAWGEEVVVGDGEVDWPSFFALVDERRIACNVIVECESSTSAFVKRFLEPVGG